MWKICRHRVKRLTYLIALNKSVNLSQLESLLLENRNDEVDPQIPILSTKYVMQVKIFLKANIAVF